METLLYFFVFTKPWLGALSLSEFPFRNFKDAPTEAVSSTGLTGYVDAAFVLFSVIYLYRHRESTRLLPYRRLWFVFLALLLLTSLFLAPFPLLALRRLVKVGVFFAMYAVAFIQSRKNQSGTVAYLKWVLRSAWLPVLYGVGDYLVHAEFSWVFMANRQYREYSTFLHANPFAYFCIIVLAMVFVLRRYRSRCQCQQGTLHLAFLAIMTVAALIMTGARAAILAPFAAFLLVDRSSWKLRVATACLGVIALLQVPTFVNPIKALGRVALNNGGGVAETLLEMGRGLDTEQFEHTGEIAGRFLVWSTMMTSLEGHYAFGRGLGYSGIFYEQESAEYYFSHNDYLTLTFETGLCGLVLYWSILIGIARLLLQQRGGVAPGSLPGLLADAGLFLIVFLAFVSCADNLFIDSYNTPLIWSILGAATGSIPPKRAEAA